MDRRCILVPLQVATQPSTVTDLQSLTVKELRQLIKDDPRSLENKGLLSKLKRKQDLVDYLQLQRKPKQTQDEKPIVPAVGEDKVNGSSVNSKKSTTLFSQGDETLEETAVTSSSINSSNNNNYHNDKLTTSIPLKMPPLHPLNGAHLLLDDESPTTESEGSLSTSTISVNRARKNLLFEQILNRYPPLRELHKYEEEQVTLVALEKDDQDDQGDDNPTVTAADMRQIYHPIFQSTNHVASADMDLIFVGTASCTPGVTRGVSCTALRLNWRSRSAFQDPNNKAPIAASGFRGGTWIFDVGECTQLQVQKTPSVKPSKITKIFLSHSHGDHSFGLTGLLCLMGQDRDRHADSQTVVDIYGPEGLRKWLRIAIRYSVSRIVPPYRVHELYNVPMAPEWQFNARAAKYFYNPKAKGKPWGNQGLAGEDPNSWITRSERIELEPSSQYGEVDGGR
jgi:Metallo-beta-lactamase superfamily